MPDVRCVAPDLLGHGQSDRPRSSPAARAALQSGHASRLSVQLCRAHGTRVDRLEACHGGIALRLFLDYPDIRRRTRALVFAAAGYRQPLPGYIREMGGW